MHTISPEHGVKSENRTRVSTRSGSRSAVSRLELGLPVPTCRTIGRQQLRLPAALRCTPVQRQRKCGEPDSSPLARRLLGGGAPTDSLGGEAARSASGCPPWPRRMPRPFSRPCCSSQLRGVKPGMAAATMKGKGKSMAGTKGKGRAYSGPQTHKIERKIKKQDSPHEPQERGLVSGFGRDQTPSLCPKYI